jgi:hypothetical protein
MKQITSRFPLKELEAYCGIESGDWAVMTSNIGSGNWPVFAVAHRRGGAIHTFVSTHGTTKRGFDQRHKDDSQGESRAGPPRKCPKVLNDWTKCQPCTDKHNRWRQSILAIEERFRTTSFPYRVFTTLIVGCAAVSTHTGFSYHVRNETEEDDDDFRETMESLAVDLMSNTWDDDHDSSQVGSARPSTRTAPSISMRSQSTISYSETETDLRRSSHMPVSIAGFSRQSGFAGRHTQRCSVCRKRLTSFCCGHPFCSNERGIVPICNPVTIAKGTTVMRKCLALHQDAPNEAHVAVASAARQISAARKRKRAGR